MKTPSLKKIAKLVMLTAALSLAGLFHASPAEAGISPKIPTTLGLVGYWSMNEGTGTKAMDRSGKGNVGTLTGAAWTDGKMGKALSFDGSSARVTASSPTKGVYPFSVSFWFKTTDNKVATNRVAYMESNTAAGAVSYLSFGLSRTSDTVCGVANKLAYTVQKQAGVWAGVCSSSTTLNDGRWHHAVGISSASNSHQLYIDGVSQGTSSTNVDALTIDGATIGAARVPSVSYYLNGVVDEIRVYNRVISAAEIATLYQSGAEKIIAPSTLGLVGYWSMNEGTGTKAMDRSGKGNAGTLTNSPTWVSGKMGKALSFNGSTNYVNLGTPSKLDFGTATNFTVTFWVKTSTTKTTQPVLIGNKDWLSGTNQGWLIGVAQLAGRQKVIMNMGDGTNRADIYASAGSAKSVDDEVWHQVAVTFNRATTAQIYFDGQAETSRSATISAVGNISTPSGKNTNVGSDGLGAYNIDANIDEVRIYNRALSAAEIATLYKSGAAMNDAPQNNRLTNGLVGYWPFNGPDVKSNTAYDRAGSNNGTMTNGATTTIGKIGQGMKFDGVNDFVTGGFVFNFTSSDFSISYWAKYNSIANSPVNIFKGENTTRGYYDQVLSTGQIAFKTNQSGISQTSSTDTGVIQKGIWYNITEIRNGASVKIYVNGVDKTTTSGTHINPDSGTNFFVGKYSNTGSNFVNGLIDEVRIYNRALTPAEIKQLYDMGR